MTDLDISASLSRLRNVSPRLNEASDKLSKTITLVEQALAELNLGVTAFVKSSDNWPSDDLIEGIGYEKLNDKWSICYSCGPDDIPECWKSVRLAAASREVRLRVVEEQLIPKLLSKLAEEAEKKVGVVEKAALACERIAANLRPVPAASTAPPAPKPIAPAASPPRPASPPPRSASPPAPPAPKPIAPAPPARPAPTPAPPAPPKAPKPIQDDPPPPDEF